MVLVAAFWPGHIHLHRSCIELHIDLSMTSLSANGRFNFSDISRICKTIIEADIPFESVLNPLTGISFNIRFHPGGELYQIALDKFAGSIKTRRIVYPSMVCEPPAALCFKISEQDASPDNPFGSIGPIFFKCCDEQCLLAFQ